jgi:hypothetical protein
MLIAIQYRTVDVSAAAAPIELARAPVGGIDGATPATTSTVAAIRLHNRHITIPERARRHATAKAVRPDPGVRKHHIIARAAEDCDGNGNYKSF